MRSVIRVIFHIKTTQNAALKNKAMTISFLYKHDCLYGAGMVKKNTEGCEARVTLWRENTAGMKTVPFYVGKTELPCNPRDNTDIPVTPFPLLEWRACKLHHWESSGIIQTKSRTNPAQWQDNIIITIQNCRLVGVDWP